MSTNMNFRLPESLVADFEEARKVIEANPQFMPEVSRRGNVTTAALMRELMLRLIDEVERKQKEVNDA